MKRYLMRSPASPFENPEHYRAIRNNLINGNSGNLLFVHSVARALMLEDVEIDFVKTNRFPEEKMEEYNQKYDAFIIPLANAFRKGFMAELQVITQMVKSLDMPCIVIGIGFQQEIGKKQETYSFDNIVVEFCDAVLEKSSCMGLRGEDTAQFLERLGYKRDKDFRIIGCPSMFLYGDKLPVPKKLNLTKNSRINMNCKVTLPQKIHDYMEGVRKQLPNHYYIPQNHYELKYMYSGIGMKESGIDIKPENYPNSFMHELYRKNRIRGFVSAEAWFEFLRKGDLNFGTRIHGNIAGILSGIPTFIVAPDSRVLELARYHNIPHVPLNELDETKDIFELLKDVDFNQIQEGHAERFRIYLDFLNENSLDTIYNHEMQEIPFDKKIQKISFYGPIVPIFYASWKEKKAGMRLWLRTKLKIGQNEK